MKLNQKLENFFEASCRKIYRNPIKTLFIVCIVISMMVIHLPEITFDTSPEGMLHEDDTSLLTYNKFQNQFGLSHLIVITIQPPEVFHEGFLKQLESLHNDLENELPYIREVTSLVNVRDVHGEGDVLYVNKLLKDWRKNNGKLDSLRERVTKNPLYLNHIISENQEVTAIVVDIDPCISNQEPDREDDFSEFEENDSDSGKPSNNSDFKKCALSGLQTMKLIDSVNRVVSQYRNSEFQIAFAGDTVVSDKFNRYVKTDMIFMIVLVNIMDIILLTLIFRRISAVILPNIIVNLSFLSTIGLMAGGGFALSVITTVIPAFLLAVGIADSIHILAIFYRHFDKTGNKEEAITHAMAHSGLAVLMTSLTTAAGLLSFSFSEVADISEMGIFSAIGVMLALLYTVIMLPALLSIFPIKQKNEKHSIKVKKERMDSILIWFTNFSTTHPKKIIIASVLIFIISVFGISKLRFSENLLRMLPDDEPVKQDNFFVDKELRGTIVVEVVVDTKKENGIYDPAVLNSIENLTGVLEKIVKPDIFVGKVFSINNILKETNQALHNNDSAYYTIPQDSKIIAQELLMFENSDPEELEKVVDSQFRKTRVSIKIPYSDSFTLNELSDEIRQIFEKEFQGRAEIIITGLADVMSRSFAAADHSMASSYKLAFTVITIMMIFLVGSIKFGLLSMIPNLLPVIAVMGIMGLAGVSLDLNALLIGSIAIGLVVDDTMHFMYNFRKFFNLTGDVYKAVKETLLGTGRAMLITSIVLISGNLCLLFATLENYIKFGFFTALVILLALLADFILAPALLSFVIESKKSV